MYCFWTKITVVWIVFVAVGNALPATQEKMVTEYIAVPSLRQNEGLHWAQITYPKGVSSARDVVISQLNSTVPELGAWYDIQTVMLSAGKIYQDHLYMWARINPDSALPVPDTMRIYSREDGSVRDLPMGPILSGAMPAGCKAFFSHTFDIFEMDGIVYALNIVQYEEKGLNGTLLDAFVAFSTVDGSILKTADGDTYFNMFEEAGETGSGQDWRAAIFKIQFFNITGGTTSGSLNRRNQEWHGNGIQHMTLNDGSKLIAFTHRMANEAVLFKDPYSYTSAKGGGSIIQRFGTPLQYVSTAPYHFPCAPYPFNAPYPVLKCSANHSADYHYFGVKEADLGYLAGGVHNVWHRRDSDAFPGKETISLFVNWASKGSTSLAVEFVINPKTPEPNAQYGDSVFETEYVVSQLSYAAFAEGGARAIGNGVFLTMGGIPFPGMDRIGLEVSDMKGSSHAYTPTNTTHGYDPFLFVCASEVLANKTEETTNIHEVLHYS